MKIAFAGTPEAAVPSLRALHESGHELVAVLTRPDARVGRGRQLAPSPVRVVAEELGLDVLTAARPEEADDHLRSLDLAAVAVVAYGALLKPSSLAVPRIGWVNLHFSLLPAWRGAAPVQHAILAGDEVTGATTFLIEEGLDTGPVLGVLTETIRPRDTTGDLLGRLSEAGAPLLVGTMDALQDGALAPVPQPAEGVSIAPKIRVEDARVVWDMPALRVDRQVRACTPDPGAWTTFRGSRIKLGPVEPTEAELPVGVLAGDLVGTATTAVRLGTVRPEGRRDLPAADWLRGLRPESGEAFA